MSLQKTLVPIDISGGIDTKTDQKKVIATSLTTLENGVFNTGSIITKRNGYVALSTDVIGNSAISEGDLLSKFKNEQILFANSALYSYVSAQNKWIRRSTFRSAKIQRETVLRNTSTQSTCDMALWEGVALYAWEDSRGGIRGSVIDLATGARYIDDTELTATGIYPRCITINNTLFVLYIEGTNLKCRIVNTTTLSSFNSATTLRTDVHATNKFIDAYSIGLNGLFCYYDNSPQITIGYLTDAQIVGSALYGLPEPVQCNDTVDNCLALFVNSDNTKIYLSWHNNTDGTQFRSLLTDLSFGISITTIDSTTTPVTKQITMAENSDGDIVIYYEVNAAATYNHYIKTATYDISGASMGASSVFKRSVGLSSKAFTYDDVVYVNAVYESSLQPTGFTIDQDGNIIGKSLNYISAGLIADPVLPHIILSGTDQFYWSSLLKTSLFSESGGVFTDEGICSILLDFDSTGNFSSADIGNGLHIGGGILSLYDGKNLTEDGFSLYPENISAVAATSGGSMADGSYGYKIVFEWLDNQGQLHQSSPSTALTATVSGGGGSGKVTLTIPTLRITNKTTVTCAVYRTEASGTIYYKVGSVANSTSADTVSYQDTTIDSSIVSNQLLYITGGIVENISPPAALIVQSFKNRLLIVPSENPETIYYSKIKKRDEPISFAGEFFLTIPALGGAVTALSEMDEKIIIFKENYVFLLTGDGPLDTGGQNTFSDPQLISSDVGCLYPKSVVLTPDGIMFKSQKGIYLLTRALESVYIGAPVEEFNSRTVTSAVLIQDMNQIRFTTDNEICLMYDYFFKKWSIFTNHSGNSAIIWDGLYHYLRDDGIVYQESAGYYRDVDNKIKLKIVTAWIKLIGLQSFQRVYRAYLTGDYKSAHIMRAKVAYDYEQFFNDSYEFDFATSQQVETWGDDATWGSGDYWGGNSNGVYEFRMNLSKQKCSAIRFSFEDIMGGTVGQSYSLSELQLEIGMKLGFRKIPSSKVIEAG